MATACTYTTSASDSTAAWDAWVQTSGTSTTASTDNIWMSWTSVTTGATASVRLYPTYQQPPAPNPEQVAERQRAELARQQKYEEETRKRKEAETRADELLKALLTPEQRKGLETMSAFVVKVEERQFKITKGQYVKELDKDGKVLTQYCIHPSGNLPPGDVMLAQKLMLETNLPGFLKTANRH